MPIAPVLLAWCAVATVARGNEARAEVATLDGAPVYHWRAFKSQLPDDVDRALVLREFQRRHFKLSPKVIDDAVRENMATYAGGDADKFARHLRELGASPEDFRRFTSEEIIINAMLYEKPSGHGGRQLSRTQAQWLAGLRAGATVKRLESGENQR